MEINNPGLSEWKHFAILSSFNSETFLTNTLGGGRVWGLHCHRKVGCKIRTGEAAHAAETCDWMKKMKNTPGFFSRKIVFEQKKSQDRLTRWIVGGGRQSKLGQSTESSPLLILGFTNT